LPIKLIKKEEKEKVKQRLLEQPQPPEEEETTIDISTETEMLTTPTPQIQIPETVKETPQLQKSGVTTVLVSKETEEVSEDVFKDFEHRDEKQIEKELLGEVIEEYVYSFGSGAQEVHGLSWKGVKEVARQMGNIKLKDLRLIEKDDSWIAQCKATDYTNRFEVYGAAQQLKNMQLKTGEERPDPFALPKVVSKAQRNALRSIIPETIVKKVLIQILGEEKIGKKIVKKGFHV